MIVCKICNSDMSLVCKSSKDKYFKCKYCRFWECRTLDEQEIYASYDDYSVGDKGYIDNRKIRVKEAKRILQHKFNCISLNNDIKSFLDIGCSEGFYVEAAEQLGLDSCGIDVPSPNNDRCRELGLNVLSTDEKLPERAYDFLLLRHTIEHIPFFIDVIQSYLHLLSDNGVLCIETPNQGGLFTALTAPSLTNDRFLRHLYPPTHVNGFEPKTYRALAKKLGLNVEKIITYSGASPDWFPNYQGTSLKRFAHNFSAKLGRGENIAAFLKK